VLIVGVSAADVWDTVEHGYADSNGVKIHYYKQNYPREPYQEDTSPLVKVKPPVLMFHGLKDMALLSPALNNTWEWLESDVTLVTVPNAGHWVQDDAADVVTGTMKSWLALQAKKPAS
jgi:pimeloyl-ACP methyl ester carboxylesterase